MRLETLSIQQAGRVLDQLQEGFAAFLPRGTCLAAVERKDRWRVHPRTKGNGSPRATIDWHHGIVGAIANRHVDKTVAASDKLIAFNIMVREDDPALLDCSLGLLAVSVLGADRWRLPTEQA